MRKNSFIQGLYIHYLRLAKLSLHSKFRLQFTLNNCYHFILYDALKIIENVVMCIYVCLCYILLRDGYGMKICVYFFKGYDNQDWFIPSPALQIDEADLKLSPDQIRETLNYFRKYCLRLLFSSFYVETNKKLSQFM